MRNKSINNVHNRKCVQVGHELTSSLTLLKYTGNLCERQGEVRVVDGLVGEVSYCRAPSRSESAYVEPSGIFSLELWVLEALSCVAVGRCEVRLLSTTSPHRDRPIRVDRDTQHSVQTVGHGSTSVSSVSWSWHRQTQEVQAVFVHGRFFVHGRRFFLFSRVQSADLTHRLTAVLFRLCAPDSTHEWESYIQLIHWISHINN